MNHKAGEGQNQRKVLSTAQRRSITPKPTACGLRRITSRRSGWYAAAAAFVCPAS